MTTTEENAKWTDALSFYIESVLEGDSEDNNSMFDYTVAEWKENAIVNSNLRIDNWIVKYIDTNLIMRDQWDNDEIAIIHKDERYSLLETIGDIYPLWKNKEWEFFVGHPSPEMFTIIDLRHG